MSKYVPDIKTKRWVVIAQSRKARPHSKKKQMHSKPKKKVCPFCINNEGLTPPEVYRIGGGEKDKPGWQVRVVPNKYPITDIHEVIIHSPDHENDFEKLNVKKIVPIFTAYRDRYRAHEADGHVLIFCNHGFHAGASLEHPHSQLVVVPKQINLDSLTREPINNVIDEDKLFITYCPEFSQWPYEVWIAPKELNNKFGDTKDDEIEALVKVFQKVLLKIEKILLDPDQPLKQIDEPFIYNFYIYHDVNWFIRIIPRAVHRAGFELGTGLNVNVIDPTDAADYLRSINV